MIPSQNDQSLTKESWPPKSNNPSDRWYRPFTIGPEWTCDCCLRLFPGNSWECPDPGHLAPAVLEIRGTKYFACAQDCARILFTIHQQYAMRETAQRERFVTVTPLTDRMDGWVPITLDLDAVSSIRTNLDQVMGDGAWVDFYWYGYGIPPGQGGLLARKEAERIMDLWKKKPWKGAVS